MFPASPGARHVRISATTLWSDPALRRDLSCRVSRRSGHGELPRLSLATPRGSPLAFCAFSRPALPPDMFREGARHE